MTGKVIVYEEENQKKVMFHYLCNNAFFVIFKLYPAGKTGSENHGRKLP